MNRAILIALVVGVVQGVFEWLPISSEGNVAVALSLFGRSPEEAVAFALFLHLGTALSATVYYRRTLRELLAGIPFWRPRDAFQSVPDERTPTLSFLSIATVVSGIVGILAFQILETLVSKLTGGAFVALIGVLLFVTGIFQRVSSESSDQLRQTPTLIDAVLVGVGQGLAILPGISRSGTTAGVLLLRGYHGTRSFELSFLLSIPAALGAGLLTLGESGVASVPPVPALVALGTAAIVGYATIGGLMRIVDQFEFWAVCVGIGGLAVIGGGILII